MKITTENALRYLLLFVFLSVTFSFAIKLLAMNQIIPWNIGYSDVVPWRTKAIQTGVPYLDKPVEYPVVVGMSMYLGSLFGEYGYLVFQYLVFLGCALITTLYLYKFSTLLKTPKKYLFLFWALAPSLLWFSYYNWDIIAVMFSVLALYYFKKENDVLGSVFIGLGFVTKIYPILLLLPVLMHRKFFSWIKNGFIVGLVFLLTNLFFIFKNFSLWFFIYGFHSGRGPNVDSIWHLLMESFSLSIPTINIFTAVLFLLGYLYLVFTKNKDFVYTSFLITLLFLLVNKVFSPQFLLWLLPFLSLYGVGLRLFYGLEIVNLSVLFSTLTHIFSKQEVTLFLGFSGIFVLLRHALLLYLFFILLKKYTSEFP